MELEWKSEDIDFEILAGKVLSKIEGKDKTNLRLGDEEIVFTTIDGEVYKLFYEHDCCAICDIVDIVGEIDDLIGTPILLAEVVTNENENPPGVDISEYNRESFTWSFYKLATIKGFVTISWYGSSNGYYNEKVTFIKIN